jgi:hypothetical protein
MSFLTQAELKTIAPTEFVTIVAGADTGLVDEVIKEMISLMKTNLGAYYDVDEIFNKTGDDRNLTVLLYLKWLVWYHLKKRRKPGAALNDEDYNEAMKWLEDVSTGKRTADLPPKKIDSDGDGIADKEVPFMKLGGRKNYQNGW